MTVEVLDFGCRLNIAEGAAIARALDGRQGITVINGCAVTGEAMRQTAQAARRAKRARPDARVIVTGCAAQTDPQRFSAMAEVDKVLGNREKLDAAHYGGSSIAVGNIHSAHPLRTPVVSGTGQTRAFVEVQTGCDHRCTFCIIPFGRGDSASVPEAAIVEAIGGLVAGGQREVVLTGVDVTSYRPSLGHLIAAILKGVPDLPRLRLSSIDPAEIDDALFDLITGEPRIMPHVHLSLQAGDDMILKRMKRRHDPATAIDLVARLKAARPEIAIGADLIAGFPTEDEAMFANSLAIVDACDIVFGHIFPYSPRPGTPAARMPQVAPAIAKDRAARLRAASAARKAGWFGDLIGSRQSVLVERSGLSGHAENFATVRLDRSLPAGSLAQAAITGSDGATLTGVAQ